MDSQPLDVVSFALCRQNFLEQAIACPIAWTTVEHDKGHDVCWLLAGQVGASGKASADFAFIEKKKMSYLIYLLDN